MTYTVEMDYDGYFEYLAKQIVARAEAIGPIWPTQVIVNAGPWRANGLVMKRLKMADGQPGTTILMDFYSALRTGFGSLTEADVDGAARLLLKEGN